MHLTQSWLRQFYAKLDTLAPGTFSGSLRRYTQHPLLQSCLASLLPYFDMTSLPENIAQLKLTEAVSILRSIDPNIDSVLANFEEPGKLDLAAYMEQHYMFNLPLEKFSYLTGRSLTTFKRDFQKLYSTTPQRWLTKKRLELAHFQLVEQRKKPIDVCFEVGFENLSHFSFAFKKQYGCSPTGILENRC